MRFIEDGPSIPDELLVARDEGRVVFFCGAGVSRARAGLPDFFGLAEQVTSALGVTKNHAVHSVLREARAIEERTGIAGLISVDRVFGLLEREFKTRDIEAAVASALRPAEDVDLSAHRTLVRLATTPSHKVRIVTTNFDRLFNDCDGEIATWQPPRLPDTSRPDELDGIVYLHGRSNKEYDGADADGFILSSAEFGRAYLSQGWATQFFRAIIQKYIVVFVGYSADDPPVQYLLEALSKSVPKAATIYAFQVGSQEHATARWRHKGIEAIPYDADDKHSRLWRTLDLWANRASDAKAWRQSVLALAEKRPGELQPYQRGQVAHLASTVEGACDLAEFANQISAEWLCVFDPHRRFADPGPQFGIADGALRVDPIEQYGLDCDLVPSIIDPSDHHTRRPVPDGAWDCFTVSHLDRVDSTTAPISGLRGPNATRPAELPVRLIRIADWFGKVSHEPAAAWWAARQPGLHPVVRRNVLWNLQDREGSEYRAVKRAWHYLFEVWDTSKDFYEDWFSLTRRIDTEGWDGSIARAYALVNRPRLQVSTWPIINAPTESTVHSIQDIFALEVAYPEHFETREVPVEWLPLVTRELRRNLDIAVTLEQEVGGYRLHHLHPLAPDPSVESDGFRDAGGLSGVIRSFTLHFDRLLVADAAAARREFLAWPNEGDIVVAQLRIWACSRSSLVSADEFGDLIASLGQTCFWDSYLQRDLLTTLAGRWSELPESARRAIEAKLLEGPDQWTGEESMPFAVRRARQVLERVSWLSSNGCTFVTVKQAELERLQLQVPHWKPDYAAHAADSMQSRGGFVRTDSDSGALLNVPLELIPSVALALSGRQDNFLVEKAPFAGLAATRPVLAFRALISAASRGDFPAELWRQFFNAETRAADRPKFMALIAERLCRISMSAMEDLPRLFSGWILKVSARLAQHYPDTFEKALSKIVTELGQYPVLGVTSIGASKVQRDWVMEAINAPVGYVAQALFNDKRISAAIAGSGLDQGWLSLAEKLLRTQGDLCRHALVIFSHNLNWLYAIDPNWTSANLLPVLDASDLEDREAFWGGFLWGGSLPNQQLYVLLKPHLLDRATKTSLLARGRAQVLTQMIVAGWGSKDASGKRRLVTNEELRGVLLSVDDEFRCRVLWHLERWTKGAATEAVESWRKQVPCLIRDAWPRQIAANTARTSAALFSLAVSDEVLFAEISSLILPLLTPIRRGNQVMMHSVVVNGQLVKKYPEQMLELLFAVLPDSANDWPYDSNTVLSKIEAADGALRLDPRFVELRRRWDSR